ncbi:hypothetical protein ATCC51561_1613 [Campylobacter concisus ATCC 51561]|nr:hypothetical protein ATCC51561_1613 [Campylobacter concisus ATCC 51561]
MRFKLPKLPDIWRNALKFSQKFIVALKAKFNSKFITQF